MSQQIGYPWAKAGLGVQFQFRSFQNAFTVRGDFPDA
jgi:hypothetical protein